MSTPINHVDPATLADAGTFRQQVMETCRPVLMRGMASGWPLLAGGTDCVIDHIRRHDAGNPAEMFIGKPGIGARYFYDDELTGFNFDRETLPVSDAVERIVATAGEPGQPSMYMGSLPSERYLPGIERATPLPFLPENVRPRLWIGHASTIACHYDTKDNVAVVAAGRRRFTLYPPDSVGDLYVGPIDHTLSGQPVSFAAGSPGGDPRYPRFERARERALVAELAPGDGIYIPKLWWHQVEALGDLNVLVNFWWDDFAAGMDQPYMTMLLAMIAIAERPEGERAAWRAWFDHYVFRPEGHPLAFLPPERHGILGPLAGGNYGRIRSIVMRALRGG